MANSQSRIQLANYLNGSGFQNRNYIVNPSAFRNTTENITLGAGVSAGDVTRNTSSPLTAISDFQIVLNSATNEYVEWNLDTIDRADQNGNCEFSGSYKLSLGSGATVQAQVFQNSVSVATLDLPAETASRRFLLNVPCGTSTTTVRFAQTVAVTTSTLNVAALYYGRASNIGSVAQAIVYGTAQDYTAASCNWSTSSASFASFAADADCNLPTVSGSLSQPATKIPGFRMLGAPAGKYKVTAVFQGAETAGNGSYRLFDGTTGVSEQQSQSGGSLRPHTLVGVFEYSGSGDRSIEIQARAGGGAAELTANSAFMDLTFTVERFPSSSEVAVTLNQQSTSLVRLSNGNGYGSTNTKIRRYSTTVQNIGTGITYADSATLGATFTINEAGFYVIARSDYRAAGGSAYGISLNSTQLTTGIDSITNANILAIANSSAAFEGEGISAVGYFNVGDVIRAHDSSTLDSTDVYSRFSIAKVQGTQSAPILVGSVTSNSTGAERIERVEVTSTCTSTPCTIATQSGSWLTSISRSATGTYNLNIASGIFSAGPQCTMMGTNGGGGAIFFKNGASSSTSYGFVSVNSGFSLADAQFSIICMGPR